jgi:corrinoid protein of di/trimethylamine methyltransferase
MGVLDEIAQNVFDGEEDSVRELVGRALKSDISADEVLHRGLIPGMDRVGEMFKEKKMYLPEVLLSGASMKAGMEIVKPLLSRGEMEQGSTVIMGTVKGDIHDIGKNVVIMMLEGAGFRVVDLGVDVPAKKFVKHITETNAAVLGLSALLTATRPKIKETIDAVTEAGLREKVKIMVGGAPITEAFAEEIGADGYAVDGATAVGLVRRLVGG